MAQEYGIGKLSGVPISSVGKMGIVPKANVWSRNGEQRESSLFRTLSDAGWATYTAGKNAASFTATSASGVLGIAMFTYTQNDGRKTYTFTFNKNAATSAGAWIIAASTTPDFSNILIPTSSIDGSGNITASIPVKDRTERIYLGIISSPSNTQTASISNLIVTAS